MKLAAFSPLLTCLVLFPVRYLNQGPKVFELINSLTQQQQAGVICVFARVGLISTEPLSISHV